MSDLQREVVQKIVTGYAGAGGRLDNFATLFAYATSSAIDPQIYRRWESRVSLHIERLYKLGFMQNAFNASKEAWQDIFVKGLCRDDSETFSSDDEM